MAAIVQGLERQIVVLDVVGSIPTSRPISLILGFISISDFEVVWRFRRSSDGVEVTLNWGRVFEDFVTQNDYNGDGRADLATWRPSEGRFYILDAVTLSVNIVPWGSPSDFPIAAYDNH